MAGKLQGIFANESERRLRQVSQYQRVCLFVFAVEAQAVDHSVIFSFANHGIY